MRLKGDACMSEFARGVVLWHIRFLGSIVSDTMTLTRARESERETLL